MKEGRKQDYSKKTPCDALWKMPCAKQSLEIVVETTILMEM